MARAAKTRLTGARAMRMGPPKGRQGCGPPAHPLKTMLSQGVAAAFA